MSAQQIADATYAAAVRFGTPASNSTPACSQYKALADSIGAKLIVYEGGVDLGQGRGTFFQAKADAQRLQRTGDAIALMIDKWMTLTGGRGVLLLQGFQPLQRLGRVGAQRHGRSARRAEVQGGEASRREVRRDDDPAAVIYDGLSYAVSKPDLGLPPAHVPNGDVNEKATRELARKASVAAAPLILDIETRGSKPINFDIRKTKPDDVRANMAYAIERIRWAKAERPGLVVGLYGVPINATYELADPDRPWTDIAAWRAANDFIAPLIAECDAAFPSLYPWEMPEPAWLQSASGTIAECRRVAPGKPVLPFLWPRDGDGKPFVSGERWRTMLRLCGQQADGVALWSWGGDNVKPDKVGVLDPAWPWWQATVRFVKQVT
jgi:hypothetical protein